MNMGDLADVPIAACGLPECSHEVALRGPSPRR